MNVSHIFPPQIKLRLKVTFFLKNPDSPFRVTYEVDRMTVNVSHIFPRQRNWILIGFDRMTANVSHIFPRQKNWILNVLIFAKS